MAFQRGWQIDLARCIGCHTCEVACQKENNTNPGLKYRRVLEIESGGYPDTIFEFVTSACNHCADPSCLPACPEGAITKDPDDGKVLIDQGRCVGCRYCIAACPYGAPQFNEESGLVEKCTFCVHRVGAVGHPTFLPACVEVCPTKALSMVTNGPAAGNEPADFASRALTNPAVSFTKSFSSVHG